MGSPSLLLTDRQAGRRSVRNLPANVRNISRKTSMKFENSSILFNTTGDRQTYPCIKCRLGTNGLNETRASTGNFLSSPPSARSNDASLLQVSGDASGYLPDAGFSCAEAHQKKLATQKQSACQVEVWWRGCCLGLSPSGDRAG